MDPFAFEDYRGYLKSVEKESKPILRGFRRKLGEAAGCNPSFVSQVFSEQQNFSLEQAVGIADFLGLENEALEYFLLMVQLARAGNSRLKTHFSRRCAEFRESREEISKQVTAESKSQKMSEQEYYSNWLYAAVHVAVTLGPLSKEALQNLLRIQSKELEPVLQHLSQWNLISHSPKGFIATEMAWHLPRTASVLNTHHMNWRLRSMVHMQRNLKQDLFYTVVASFSEKDFNRFRRELIRWIAAFTASIRGSKAEVVANLNIDFSRF